MGVIEEVVYERLDDPEALELQFEIVGDRTKWRRLLERARAEKNWPFASMLFCCQGSVM